MKKPIKKIKTYTEKQRIAMGITRALMDIQEYIDDDPTKLKTPKQIMKYIDKRLETVMDDVPTKCDTKEGYCCACDYDIACMEHDIEKAKEELLGKKPPKNYMVIDLDKYDILDTGGNVTQFFRNKPKLAKRVIEIKKRKKKNGRKRNTKKSNR